jgi:hypothetical protein
MKGPPSLRCQRGAGKRARSTACTGIVFCKNEAFFTATGAHGSIRLRLAIQALSASSGRRPGSTPSASAARCALVTALVKMRNPCGKPLISSKRRAGPSGRPAATSVMPPISQMRSAPLMRRSACRSSTRSMNSRKSLYIASCRNRRGFKTRPDLLYISRDSVHQAIEEQTHTNQEMRR